MLRRPLASPQDRLRSAVLVAALHGLLSWALLRGLGVAPPLVEEQDALALIDVPLAVEPEPSATPMIPEAEPEPTERPKDPEGAAAPPALRNTPTPVVAPPPAVRLPVTSPVPASPIAGTGSAANPGAAELPGPGTGRGGEGEGLGSGRFGDGTGGGGGGGVAASGPFHRGGEIEERDAPRDMVLLRSHRATFRLLVGRNGRVLDCRITGSTGLPLLDAATCAAAVRRLRWHPARDRAGRVVEAWAPGSFTWHPAPLPEEVRD